MSRRSAQWRLEPVVLPGLLRPIFVLPINMKRNIIAIAARLSDSALRRRLGELAGNERGATVELIAHLAEFDRRKLHREQGYGSLFSYCTGELRLSEHAAFNRIEAARACRSLPVILDLLEEGAVNLSTLRLLAPHLTPENHVRLLGEARGCSKREVEAIVAGLMPRQDVPASIRKLPAPSVPVPPRADSAVPAALSVEITAPAAATPPSVATSGGAIASTGVAQIPAQRPIVAPLTPER